MTVNSQRMDTSLRFPQQPTGSAWHRLEYILYMHHSRGQGLTAPPKSGHTHPPSPPSRLGKEHLQHHSGIQHPAMFHLSNSSQTFHLHARQRLGRAHASCLEESRAGATPSSRLSCTGLVMPLISIHIQLCPGGSCCSNYWRSHLLKVQTEPYICLHHIIFPLQ